MLKHGPIACCTQLLVAEEGVWPRLTNLGDSSLVRNGESVMTTSSRRDSVFAGWDARRSACQ